MCPYLYGTLLFEKFTEQSKLTSELKLHSNTIANITYINTFNNKIQNKKLTSDQMTALKNIEIAQHQGKLKNFLLYGVTGSGKTQIYIEMALKARALGNKSLYSS